METLLMIFVCSLRKSNFFLSCLQDIHIPPWMFTLDYILYTKLLNVYAADLLSIEVKNHE